MIEHIALYHGIIKKLKGYVVPATFDGANMMLGEIFSSLVKASHGTRIDWKALLASDVDGDIEGDQLKYKREENRADREAKSIMSAIDSLSKAIKGTREVYEILCEFAHPNVGNFLIVTESVEPSQDTSGLVWMKKRLSSSVPQAFMTECLPLVRRLFRQLDQCLLHFETLQKDGVKEHEKVLKITQMVVTRLVAKNKGLIEPYAPCPCGSEKKVRFCCGRKTST